MVLPTYLFHSYMRVTLARDPEERMIQEPASAADCNDRRTAACQLLRGAAAEGEGMCPCCDERQSYRLSGRRQGDLWNII